MPNPKRRHSKARSSKRRAHHDFSGGVVAPHRINDDSGSGHAGAGLQGRLLFLDRANLPAVVIAAVLADLVREFHLLALRATRGRRFGQRIMRTAFGCA